MQNPASDIIVKTLFPILSVICGFAAINYKKIRRLRNVATHFHGSLAVYSLFLPTVEGIYDTLRFSLHAGPQFLEIPGTLKIRLFVRPQITLRVCRRSLFAKAARRLRLLHEVTTGDPLFDAKIRRLCP